MMPGGGSKLREALELTERNLGSLIAAKQNMGVTENGDVMQAVMVGWRREVRKALGWGLDL